MPKIGIKQNLQGKMPDYVKIKPLFQNNKRWYIFKAYIYLWCCFLSMQRALKIRRETVEQKNEPKDTHGEFTEELQMANTDIKRCSTTGRRR